MGIQSICYMSEIAIIIYAINELLFRVGVTIIMVSLLIGIAFRFIKHEF